MRNRRAFDKINGGAALFSFVLAFSMIPSGATQALAAEADDPAGQVIVADQAIDDDSTAQGSSLAVADDADTILQSDAQDEAVAETEDFEAALPDAQPAVVDAEDSIEAAPPSDEVERATPASEFAYDGEALTFAKEDGSEFGMYAPQEGTKACIDGGKVIIDYYPKRTTYVGFYLGADVSMAGTWSTDAYYALENDNGFHFELDESYCGKAWPVVPVKSDGAAASAQYYLCIPSADKLGGATATMIDVTFNNNGGTAEPATQTVSVQAGTALGSAMVADPIREGFTFTGWNTAPDSTGEAFTSEAVVDAAVTLFAQWRESAAVSEFAYDGDVLTVLDFGGGYYGMFNPQEGTQARISGNKVIIDYYPQNKTVYAGFYLGADAADSTTWLPSSFFAKDAEGNYHFELDESYCGKAWPIAPTKVKDPTASTAKQYYLYIPAADKLGYAPTAVERVREAIGTLPANVASLVSTGLTSEQRALGNAYLALADGEKAQLTDDECVHLAKVLIAVLPSDPSDITQTDGDAIKMAQSVYETLSSAKQKELDDELLVGNRSYGRYLENDVWGLDALTEVDNSTTLADGTYTGVVKTKTNMGKSTSRRAYGFTVKSITVKDGKATAIIEHGSSTSAYLFIGGKKYGNLQTASGGKSYYEIPIDLNSTFHFSVKGKAETADTDGIAYEVTATIDEKTAKPDSGGKGNQNPSSATGGDNGSSGSGSGGTAAPSKGISDSNNGGGGSGFDSGRPASGKTSSGGASKAVNSGSGVNIASMLSAARSGSSGASKTAAANGGSNANGADGAAGKSDSGKAGASASKRSAVGKSGSEDETSSEVGGGSSAFDSAGADANSGQLNVVPAIVGALLLTFSAGVLMFTLRFRAREGYFV